MSRRIVAAQVAEGTTITQRAKAGDKAAQKQLIGARFTEPDPKNGGYKYPDEEQEESNAG